MKQWTLGRFTRHAKSTRRARFLAEMERAPPWSHLAAAVEPIHPKAGPAIGRPRVQMDRMLRFYFLQLWFSLSDPAAAEALDDSEAMRRFARIDSAQEAAPDETTACNFRRLLEHKGTVKSLLMANNRYPHDNGIKISKRILVDATILNASSSTKDKQG